MASTFYRFATVGGDNNAWGAYVLAQERKSIGEYSSYLFDDAGTLTISAGQIGISDGTNTGISDIDETVIVLTGTAGIWQKIEMGVSGSTVTFYSTDLAGETDPAVLPAAFTSGYVDAKRGYYIIGTRRTIGVVWVDSGGTLGGVINSKSNIKGYQGLVYLNTAQTEELYYNYTIDTMSRWAKIPIGDWNMLAATGSASVSVSHNLGSEINKRRSIDVWIVNDAGSAWKPLNAFQNLVDPDLIQGGVFGADSAAIALQRRTGGYFDSVSYDSTSYNRGWVYVDLEE